MADKWYYSEHEQRRGPVSEEELKQYAVSGQLKPKDKVWKKGMASWAAASSVEGIAFPSSAASEPPPLPFDNAASPHGGPPPVPARRKIDFSGATSKAKGFAASLAKRGKAAAQLVAKQAERTKLVNVSLPAVYQALGRHIHGEGRFRDEFPEIHKQIDGLLAEIAKLQTQAANAPKAEGLSAKAKALANTTKDIAQTQAVKLKLNHAFAELGKAVFEKHGNESGPEAVVRPLLAYRARVEKLDSEIKGLSQSQPGQIVTPKRLAIGGVCVAAAVVLLLLRSVFSAAGSSQSEVARGEDGKASLASSAAAKAESESASDGQTARTSRHGGKKSTKQDDDYTSGLPPTEATTLVKRYIELSESVPDENEQKEMSLVLDTLVSYGAEAAPTAAALAKLYVSLSDSVPDESERKEMAQILNALGGLGVHARSAHPILTARYSELSDSVPDAEERREMTMILQTTSRIGGLPPQRSRHPSNSRVKSDDDDDTSSYPTLPRNPVGVSDGEVNRAVAELMAKGLTADQRKLVLDGIASGMTEKECYQEMGKGLAYRNNTLNGPRNKDVSELTDEEKAVIYLNEMRKKKQGE